MSLFRPSLAALLLIGLAFGLWVIPRLGSPSPAWQHASPGVPGEVLITIDASPAELGWRENTVLYPLEPPHVRDWTLLWPSLSAHECLSRLDNKHIYRMRFWCYEYPADTVPLVSAQLESIRDGDHVLFDGTVCPRHRRRMTRQMAPIVYGLLMQHGDSARDYPHALQQSGGCVTTRRDPSARPAYVCVDCEATAQAEIRKYEAWLRDRSATP